MGVDGQEDERANDDDVGEREGEDAEEEEDDKARGMRGGGTGDEGKGNCVFVLTLGQLLQV